MNNKGFTLVEMLAVIVILAAVGGIATYGVTRAINISKEKTEDVFIEKISDSIDGYIGLNYRNTTSNSYLIRENINSAISFEKKISSNEDLISGNIVSQSTNVWEVKLYNKETEIYSNLQLQDILDANITESKNLVNPKNNKQCTNADIAIYMDSDSVFYYYTKLDCFTDNKIVNTLPKELICSDTFNNNEIKNSYNASVSDEEKCS